MTNNSKKITAFAAAVLISLSSTMTLPGSVLAEHAAPAAASDSGKEHHPHHVREGKFRAGGHFIIIETAKLLDMDRLELINSLKAGKTLSGLALEKKGWNEDQYIQKLSEAAGQRLDKSIAEGQLTEAEAKKLKAELPVMLKHRIGKAGYFFQKSAGHQIQSSK